MNVFSEINKIMQENHFPYSYKSWKNKVQYPYIIGEYIEKPTFNEDGMNEYDFILTITNKGTWAQVEEIREKIKGIFPKIYGCRITADNSSAVIFYSHCIEIPTVTEEYQRMEIHLTVKEWGSL